MGAWMDSPTLPEEPQAGDVILVARVGNSKLVSRIIRRSTDCWYSHALIALGEGRFMHSTPDRMGAAAYINGEDEFREVVGRGNVCDLFRPQTAPDAHALRSYAESLNRQSDHAVPAQLRVVYSDGILMALALLRWIQRRPRLLATRRGSRLHEALLVATGTARNRVFCSSLVHELLEAAGSPVAAPPFPHAFVESGRPVRSIPKVGKGECLVAKAA